MATPVTPNQLTTASLLLAIAACAGFASGEVGWMDAAAGLFILSRILDYMDGALARAKSLSSRFGERYDQTVDTLGYALMFIGVAIGLRDQVPGLWLPVLAALAVIGGVSKLDRMEPYAAMGSSLPAIAPTRDNPTGNNRVRGTRRRHRARPRRPGAGRSRSRAGPFRS
jgi:phosphatidylglycerophosphate synthase